jgi:HD superfamily phosphohydrolase
MQRDRLMSGVQISQIDLVWLLANLDVGVVPLGVDDERAGEIETFVLGPKASHAAETYVLALFQLYPTVYFHKTTRAAEKIFTALMMRLVELVRDAMIERTGLPDRHPIVRFALEPNDMERALSLDDMVFWGVLPMLREADDPLVADFADRLSSRRLPKCIDVYQRLASVIQPARSSDPKEREERTKRLKRAVTSVDEKIQEWSKSHSVDKPRVLTDIGERAPYRTFQESKGPLNQIRIRTGDGMIDDVVRQSDILASMQTFNFFRAYCTEEDDAARKLVNDVVDQELREGCA